MSWLKVTGMIPAEAGNAWVSGNIVATALRAEDEGWADGTRRAVWPIEGVLAGSGTRWEARLGGDYYLPGAIIGESTIPPSIELLAELKDQQGRTRRFRSVGKVAASSPGEWSINAPLGSVIIKGQNSGPNSWLETTVAQVENLLPQMQQSLADTVQAAALAAAAAGLIAYAGGDHTTLPNPAGSYRIMTGSEAGQVWTRAADGAAATRNTALEALTKALADALGARLSAVETGQASSTLGYLTLAAMNADLARPAGALARVTNDPTPANNADYIKLGASGAGSWQAASTSRIAAAEGNITTNTAQISGLFENRARTSRTAQMISQALGIRSGAPALPIYSSGTTTFSYVDNDGTWPLSPQSWPKIMRATAVSTALLDFGPRTLGSVVWATGRKVTWGVWFNRTAAATFTSDRLWGQAIWLTAAGTTLSSTVGGGIPLAQWATIGATATLNGLTATITAVRGGLSYVQYTVTAPANTYGVAGEFRLSTLTTPGNTSGTMDLIFNGLLLDTDTIDPYMDYGDTQADADPAGAVKGVQAALLAKVDKTPSQRPTTIVNALRGRYSAASGSAVSGRVLVSAGATATWGNNEASFAANGEPNVLHIEATNNAGQDVAAFFISAADLASIGVVPNDITPPSVSVRTAVLLNSLVGLTAATLNQGLSNGSVQVWTTLRYGGSLSQAIPSVGTDRVWTTTTGPSIYLGAGATTGAATRTLDALRVWLTRSGIPIPATLSGAAFTGMLVQFSIRGAGTKIAFDVDREAVINGSVIDLVSDYYNLPEDQIAKAIGINDLGSELKAQVTKPGGSVRIVKSGALLYVGSALSSTEMMFTSWKQAGANNAFQPYGVSILPASAADSDIPSLFSTPSNKLQDIADDPAPTRTNTDLAGGNHGWYHLLLTAASHDKTFADIGSIWTDGTNQFTLLGVQAGQVRVTKGVTTNPDGGWTSVAQVPVSGSTLTHVSGAAHTAAISITASTISSAIPAVRPVSFAMYAGKTLISADGSYSAEEVVVDEIYDILDYRAQLNYIRSLAGTGLAAAPNYQDASIPAMMRVQFKWRIRGARARQEFRIKNVATYPIQQNGSGIVQAEGLNTPAGGTRTLFIPGTKPVTKNGQTFDFGDGAGADVTAMLDSLGNVTLTPDTWLDPDVPPSEFRMAVRDSAGAPVYALTLGYESVANGVPISRKRLLDGNLAFMIAATTEKLYPAFTWLTLAPGDAYQGVAYRHYSRS